jgi:hypothetical protein
MYWVTGVGDRVEEHVDADARGEEHRHPGEEAVGGARVVAAEADLAGPVDWFSDVRVLVLAHSFSLCSCPFCHIVHRT